MPKPILDAMGREVPLHLRKAHKNSQRLTSAAQLLARAVRVVEGLKTVPGGEWIPAADVLRGLAVVKAALLSAGYLTSCPACEGAGCSRCKKRGWLPVAHKLRIDELAKERAAPVKLTLSIDELAASLGCKRLEVLKLVEDGTLPKPIKLGHITRWEASAVGNTIKAMHNAANSTEGGLTYDG